MPERARLDVELARRGLARSRSHAAQLVAAGLVTVEGRPATRSSAPVAPEDRVEVAEPDHYVGRAAHKLVAALDSFAIPVAGRVALDVGASTGGFTHVMLERGATRVVALDVGHGQLDARVASDPRVLSLEGVNARFLTRERLERLAGPVRPDLVVADLSFISLRTVLPALVATVGTEADVVVLVKPQFEVGRAGVHEGVVRDPALRLDALTAVLWAAWDEGLRVAGVIASPLAGAKGNREYLAHFAPSGTDPGELAERLAALA